MQNRIFVFITFLLLSFAGSVQAAESVGSLDLESNEDLTKQYTEMVLKFAEANNISSPRERLALFVSELASFSVHWIAANNAAASVATSVSSDYLEPWAENGNRARKLAHELISNEWISASHAVFDIAYETDNGNVYAEAHQAASSAFLSGSRAQMNAIAYRVAERAMLLYRLRHAASIHARYLVALNHLPAILETNPMTSLTALLEWLRLNCFQVPHAVLEFLAFDAFLSMFPVVPVQPLAIDPQNIEAMVQDPHFSMDSF